MRNTWQLAKLVDSGAQGSWDDGPASQNPKIQQTQVTLTVEDKALKNHAYLREEEVGWIEYPTKKKRLKTSLQQSTIQTLQDYEEFD